MHRLHPFALLLAGLILLIFGCTKPPSPLNDLIRSLKEEPTYSIILDDMQTEGNFVRSYQHKYQVVADEFETTTDWQKVDKKTYARYEPYLGMTIMSKQDGKLDSTAGPAGYEYVGNEKYGRWQTDSSGRSFWVFYGQYRLLSDLFGGRPIYRSDYSTYTSYRSQGRPYFGSGNQYGTTGSVTKKQRPNFYARKMNKSASFGNKVNKRIGRTRTSSRSRSRGVGK
jgi:hypothetical protein